MAIEPEAVGVQRRLVLDANILIGAVSFELPIRRDLDSSELFDSLDDRMELLDEGVSRVLGIIEFLRKY